MAIESKSDIKTPFYYIKRRLFKNKLALIGLVVILLAHLVVLLGYLIIPDKTPNCNDSAWQIKKKTPGFEVYMLKVKKSIEVEEVGFLESMYMGQEHNYIITPIESFDINGLKLTVHLEGHSEKTDEYNLVDLVYGLSKNITNKITPDSSSNAVLNAGQVKFLNTKGEIQTVAYNKLVSDFKENNLDKRKYYLGTDIAGRDMLSRLLFGTRISLGIGFVSVLISLTLGVLFGAAAGFFGGKVDSFIMWLMTVVWSIPGIMLVSAISLALGKGIWVAFVAVGLTTWVEIARVIRGQLLSVKEKLYIEAARALGLTNIRIILVHIMPNIMGPLIVIATSNFASAILTEAGLSFLGLGVQAPMPSWGIMINEGYHSMGAANSWHLIFFPSFCICITVLAFNLFGNGLRDAYDPQSGKKW